MIQHIPLERILFIDIETVPGSGSWEELPESERMLWDKKTGFQRKDEISAQDFYSEKAGIMAEFGKIICITIGMLEKNDTLKIKSFAGHNEKKILQEFGEIFNSQRLRDVILCAHNGKEFDFPYLSRRMLINGIRLPHLLDTATKKPWEVQHLDTMELWKFGDYKNYTSLHLLANCLGIPTPKDGIDGSQVKDVYYIEKNMKRLVEYCQKDVIATAQIFLRFQQLPLLPQENIFIAD